MSWAEQKRSIDRWREDVAYAADPIIIATNGPAFRRGVPAPDPVIVDSAPSVRSAAKPVSVRAYRPNGDEPTIIRRRTLGRRPSSDHGGYSRKGVSARSPTRTIVETTAPIRRSSLHHPRIAREEPPPSRSTRTQTRAPLSSLRTSLLPSTQSSRSRTVTYERPGYERSSYDTPRARAISPRYSTARDPEPEVVRYKSRPRSVYSSKQQPVISSREVARSGSVEINDRMRLLGIRDRFRDEVDKARDWRRGRPERYRESDRRSARW